MRLVIADTGPVNYLILIGHIDLLPALFEKVILPSTVQNELASRKAPSAVRQWVAALPDWLEVRGAPPGEPDEALKRIDAGERAAIQLAVSLHADLLLMDDRKGVRTARNKGFRVTGTLGILELAAQAGLVDFAQAAERLRETTFRNPQALLDAMLKKHKEKKARD